MGTLQSNVLLQQARRAYAASQWEQARRLCTQLLGRDGNNADALILLGRIAMQHGQREEASSHALKAAALRPADPQAHALLAEILVVQGRFDDAVVHFDKVLHRDPENARATAGKADAYQKSGRADKARALLQPFIEQGKETVEHAVVQARLDLSDRNFDTVIDLTSRHIAHQEAEGRPFPNLYFLLGGALERSGRFDEAFAAYERGNTAIPAPFDRESWARAVDGIIESFSPQQFARVPRASHGARRPIFVVGMPRSGTTLVETILDAHADVAGAGELQAMEEIVRSISLNIGSNLPYPACIEDLDSNDVDAVAAQYLDRLREIDGRAQRIVDKYLGNYLHLGLLAILFPQASVIHCRRHPLDTCFSCFCTPLSSTTHAYATDLASVGAVFLDYERIMHHWRDVLKIPMLEVSYEALVADQEGMTRRLLDFCGLAFDERCLRFYESGKPALTASYDQVNRPIYSSSVGRYRNFERHLGPLKETLAEGGWTEEALARAATG